MLYTHTDTQTHTHITSGFRWPGYSKRDQAPSESFFFPFAPAGYIYGKRVKKREMCEKERDNEKE
jgi:hypothetical protein